MSWKLVENVANMNPVRLVKLVLSTEEVEKYITDLNTRIQLSEENENSLGVKLYTIGGSYSNTTLSLNPSKKGKNNIDLYDTGEFYSSFKINIISNGDFEIIADPFKTDENGFTSDLRDRWSDEIIGLNKENHEKAIKFIEEKVLEILWRG